MTSLGDKSLRSERLTYRLLEAGDKAALRTLLSDRSVTEPAGFLPAESEARFDDFFAELTRYGTGIAILREDELVGYIRIRKHHPDQEEYAGMNCVSTGFVIGKPYQNQGYATETFATLTVELKRRFDYCFVSHFKENVPSGRVIEKCGYRRLGEYTIYFDELGREERCVEYVY